MYYYEYAMFKLIYYMTCRLPVLWAQTNREAVEEAGKLGEIFYYMRAGGAGLYLIVLCD